MKLKNEWATWKEERGRHRLTGRRDYIASFRRDPADTVWRCALYPEEKDGFYADEDDHWEFELTSGSVEEVRAVCEVKLFDAGCLDPLWGLAQQHDG